jgi:hypothetical protein
MTWANIQLNPPPRVLRQFTVAVLVFAFGWAVAQWIRGHQTAATVLAIVGAVVGLVGFLFPRALRWLFVGCMIATFPIGWLISQFVLALTFYLIITPIALFFRMLGRDVLQLKRPSADASLWKPKKQPDDIRRYLRQY